MQSSYFVNINFFAVEKRLTSVLSITLGQVAEHIDPCSACAAVVAESYRLWLHYETRTDDITIIVVRLNGLFRVSRNIWIIACIAWKTLQLDVFSCVLM